MSLRLRKILVSVVLTYLAMAYPSDPAFAEKIGTVAQPLNVASSTVWSGPIPVCWQFAGRDADKAEVSSAIASTWETESAVRFTGWGLCPSSSGGIRIAIEDAADKNPHTVDLGNRLDGRKPGMVLNFDFKNWSSSCSSSDAIRKSCIRSVAVHEFGHALGFSHEQNRTDAACETQPQGGNGDVVVGIADLSSIMNYCNPSWNNNGKLSATDIVGVRQFYGPPQKVVVGFPDGSYRRTCSNIAADNDHLYATCRARNQVEWRTALSNWKACRGSIDNLDGRLSCSSNPLPAGSYRITCRDTAMDGDVLEGSCKKRSGSWVRTQLAQVSACSGEIQNLDGSLQCPKNNAPGGSYSRTCNDVNLNGTTLFANCRTRDGHYVKSFIREVKTCSGDIANIDGYLRCPNGLAAPSGSYSRTCSDLFNNVGDLGAHCRRRNGDWIWSALGDFASCRGDIGNNDGHLECKR